MDSASVMRYPIVSTSPSEPMTTPCPIRSVPSAEAVKAESGTSECTCTTDWSAASRLKRRFSCRGCRRSGKAQSVVSPMNRLSAVVSVPPHSSRQPGKVTGGGEHTSANEHTVRTGPSDPGGLECGTQLSANDNSVRDLVVQTLAGFLVDHQRIDELIQPAHVGEQVRQAVDHVPQQ